MPAVLTHKAVMLLTRERLATLRDRLQAKVDAGGTVTDLEHRVLYLAGRAHAMMSDDDVAPPDGEFPTDPESRLAFTRGVSRFAVMGSMGPDITGFSGIFVPGQSWVFDIIHKGNPDVHMEPVVARTTDFSLELWREAASLIDARAGDAAAGKAAARKAVQGYVLGHLCHIAGDVISHPFINDVEWHLGVATDAGKRERFEHSTGEGSIDSRVAREVFRQESIRSGPHDWAAWWPAVDDVPAELYTAYDSALDRVYAARRNRPTGFGAFEERWRDGGLPPLTADFIKDGYGLLRKGVIPMGYGWGYWSWFGFLTPAIVPLAAAFPLALAMPRGSELTGKRPWEVDERGWFEFLMVPLAVGSVIPIFYGIWIATLTTHGVEAITGVGLAAAFVTLIEGIIALATVGVEDLAGWVRWLVIWGPPVGFGLYFVGQAIADFARGAKARGVLSLIYAAPFLLMALMAVLVLGLGSLISLIVAEAGSDDAADVAQAVIFWVFLAIVCLAAIVLWFALPPSMRDARIPESPEPFAAERRHFARLFDDATLFHDSSAAPPDLAGRFYPSDARPLLKLWWTGGGEMHVRSRRTHIEFSFSGEGEPDQAVPAPLAPMTAADFAEILNRTVQDSGGATGSLQATVVHTGELAAQLPAGPTFSDEGDRAESVIEHFEQADEYRQLGDSEEDTEYVLRHAPRFVQAVRYGLAGPVPFDPRETGLVRGTGTVSSDGKDVTGVDTSFRTFFDPGDRIQAGNQIRTITLITSDTELRVATEFNPGLEEGAEYERVGDERERGEGFGFIPSPGETAPGGETIMERAADLGVLLCLGAAPHLLSVAETRVPSLNGRTAGGAAVEERVAKVYQVFRNWNLDRRRENEWRMLIAGGAVDEKDGDPKRWDATMRRPQDGAWSAPPDPVAAVEPVTRRLGWVELLRRWSDGPASAGTNALDTAGDSPTNQELSRALAYLLDMPDPAVLD